MDILIPVIILGSLGLLFGLGLALASKKLHVETDPRLDMIHGLLPGSNCGACGGAGCFGFAESVLSGKLPITACRVSSHEAHKKIAELLGQDVEKSVKKVAVVHCCGGTKALDKYLYEGIKECVAAAALHAGYKACRYGCLGFGTCVAVCPFGAITMGPDRLPVVDDGKCTGCSKCVLVCPKKIIALWPAAQRVYVACCSHDTAKDTRAACSAGCIACRMCEKACRFGAIRVVNNLAVIDETKCTQCGECVKVCPVKVIRMKSSGGLS
jgi:RnfABCDGE-type electron transport complex B subunit